jgi:hypothetical protein
VLCIRAEILLQLLDLRLVKMTSGKGTHLLVSDVAEPCTTHKIWLFARFGGKST